MASTDAQVQSKTGQAKAGSAIGNIFDAGFDLFGSANGGLESWTPMQAPLFATAGVSATAGNAASSLSSAIITPMSAASGTATATSSPAWVATLSTSMLATDMGAAIVNGAVTFTGLSKLFSDLAVSLTSAKTTLTTATFNDLKTIAANLNNGVTSSAYLTSITNALVNGSGLNKTWTGGATSSVTLGNLTAGSTATQVTELVGKWFLGTDLPNAQVLMSGSSSFTVSYSTTAKPLYGSSGPSMNDINQGYLGDCYLLSSLAEVANHNPNAIKSMITDNGNGTYGVRFYVNGQAQYVTVNSQLANGGTIFNSGSSIWASIVEKAYAELQTNGPLTGNTSVNYGNSWSTIGNGGVPFYALEEVTGASQLTYFAASGGSWNSWTLNASLATTGYSGGLSTSSVLGTLVSALSKGYDVILSSNTDAKDSSGKQTLVSGHAMSIYGYDSATGLLQVRNPWGSSAGQYWNTTFEVSLSTLLAAGDAITVDNVAGQSVTPPSPPVVANQTAAQTWKMGSAVNFTLPTNTFTDPQGQALTYSATLANGSALPTWLKFNATTGTFSGTVPNNAAGLSIKVTATDTSGLSVSETFNVSTPAAPPVLNSQTAAQTWKLGSAVNFTLPANTFTDPQGQALTYSATLSNGSALPSWLKFNATTGAFSGNVPNNVAGLSIKVTATDTSGLSVSETFNVSTPAAPPVLSSQTGAQTWKLGSIVNFTLPTNTFTDPQGQALTYSATLSNGSALPSWLKFNASTGTFSGTVPTNAAGLSIKVTATDTSGLTASETFSVATPASAPVLTSQTAAQTWKMGSAVNFTLPTSTFTDPQGQALTYSATLSNGSALPSWLKFNASTGTFSGTVPNNAAGLSIKVTATDTAGLSTSEIFTVSTPASAPVLNQQTANQTWKAGSAVNLALPSTTFKDPQGQTLAYAATQTNGSALPSWLKFNAATETFTGTAPTSTGSIGIKVTATDTSGLSVSETFTATIGAAASALAQAISSLPSTSSVSAALSGNASSSNPTLATPMHA